MSTLYASDRWNAAKEFQRRYAQNRKARLVAQARDPELDWEVRDLARRLLRQEYALWSLPEDLRR